MNLNLTTDEFHRVIMLYLINIARENKAILMEGGNIVYSEDFDMFLKHIISKPLGKLTTSYQRSGSKVKLSSKMMTKSVKDQVRMII